MSPGDALRALLGDRRGSVAVEAALALSILMIAAVGAIDGARFLQASARAERLTANIADMASRSTGLRDRLAIDSLTRPDDLGMFVMLARRIAQPADLTQGGVALSAVTGTGDGLIVNWMRADGEGATTSAARLAQIGGLPEGADFIVAEVFLPFDAILLDGSRFGFGLPDSIYRRAVFRSRSADLSLLEPAA
jgi:hypothetical protein